MTSHKHAAMIKAKADNMELVVFRKNYDNSWGEIQCHDCCFMSDFDYFLCLPKHKEACLHWLNGGEIECRSVNSDSWFNLDCADRWKWSPSNNTMSEKYETRIKPRKEKRWVGVHFNSNQTTPAIGTYKLCYDYVLRYCFLDCAPFCEWQFIEIEVEV